MGHVHQAHGSSTNPDRPITSSQWLSGSPELLRACRQRLKLGINLYRHRHSRWGRLLGSHGLRRLMKLIPLATLVIASSLVVPLARAETIVATVPVGSVPEGVAYDSAKGEVFVTNLVDGTVSVISDSTNAIVATVPVGLAPIGAAYDPAKGEVFVANSGSTIVSVISDSINAVVATVQVGSGPEGVAYDSAKGEVFVTNFGSNTVSVISDSTNAVVATMPVQSGPIGVAYDSAKGEVFVASV